MKISYAYFLSMLVSLTSFAQETLTLTTGPNWEDVTLQQDTRSGKEFVANTNYASSSRITSTAWTASGQPTYWRTLLRFNLNSIPAGATIQSATLYLYSDPNITEPHAWNGNSPWSGSNAFYLEKVTQDWNQNTVTWNTQPATTTSGRVWVGPSTNTTENRQVNITAIVQDWVNNPASNRGVKMILENELRYRGRSYGSTNHPNTGIHPRLVITYEGVTLIGTYREQLDHLFGAIDKSQIPAGRLEEYGNGYLPFDAFNGVLSDSNRVNIKAWRMLYSSLYSTRIHGTHQLIPLGDVNQSLNAHRNADYTLVPVILAPYSSLKPGAIDDNLLQIQNNQLVDVPGRTEIPYEERWLFAASPVKNYTEDGTVILRFSSEFTIDPTNNIQQIAIDFDDGRGYVSAVFGTDLSATYPSTGLKRIKIKATLTDGRVFQCFSDLEVLSLPVAVARYSPIQDFIQSFTANTNHLGGRAFVRYDRNNTERTLNKPLIVVEGYDISSRAPDLQRNYSFANFIRDIEDPEPSFNFNSRLDDIAGYDLIFLDYNDGADDIRRNAELLEEVIAWVNQQKANAGSSEQNVILGISMGGLVARYALAEMTKAGTNPQTRLLITHDSPHRGANTPLGLQFLSRAASNVALLDLLNVLPEVEQSNRILDAPATQQLLILRATNDSGGVSSNTFLNGDYRNMITFPSGGPQPAYQVVATSLGAACGEQQLVQPYDELARVTGKFLISPIPWIRSRSYNTEIISNALPASGSHRIMKFRIWIQQRILRFIKINVNLTNKSANSPSNTLAWDSAPGGTQNVRQQVSGDFPKMNVSFWWFLELRLNSSFAEDFCFVPTVSALDITTINQAALTDEYNWGISPGNNARVNNFVTHAPQSGAGSFNEVHPRFTARNAEWLYNVMENIPNNNLNCLPGCSPDGFRISGQPTVCDQATYSLNELPPGAMLSWSTSPNLTPISGQGTNSFTVASGSNGAGWVDVSVNTVCGTGSAERKNVQVGRPPVIFGDIYCSGMGTACPINDDGYLSGREYNFRVDVTLLPGETSEWSIFNGQITVGQFNSSSVRVRLDNPLNAHLFALTYTKSNLCGTMSKDKVFYYGDYHHIGFSVSPNPSDQFIEIRPSLTVNHDERPKSTTAYELKLYNNQQRQVKHMGDREAITRLDVTDLPPGYYILHIVTKTSLEKHRVIVN